MQSTGSDNPRVKPAFDQHPTVLSVRRQAPLVPVRLTLERLKQLALEAGADDAGVVSIDHPDLSEETPYLRQALPGVRSVVALVLGTHKEDIRSPTRSVANGEFHRVGERMDEVAARVAQELSRLGHPSLNPPMAFPMEMDAFPGRTWVVSHKKVAVAAQLGRIGLHRSVIHPRLGSFVLLGSVLTEAEVEGEPERLGFDPCVSCKLCVAACPVGAIEPDGAFRFSACYDHNYREFMTGFGDVLEQVAESRDRHELRERVTIAETASIWQSLSYKPSYKAAYCIAVCPAGEEVMRPFLEDRSAFLRSVVKPLTGKEEPVYVVAGSDAEEHAKRRFPHKRLRVVQSSLRPTSARGFFAGLPLTFQRGPARGLRATFHFELTDAELVQATVVIDDGAITVQDGLIGEADVSVAAATKVWLEVVTKKRSAVWAVLTGRLKTRGDRSLLARFAACFPR
ncbi:MAG: 4Fe-4S ferredoxin [Myxococcales bacterium]|nr:MAG: 4Fe-4S ferredoxin [Myxococcales bacterium]